MIQKELETLIEARVIQDVVLISDGWGWEIGTRGENIPSSMGNRVKHTRRGGEVRTWATLDTAYRWIRDRGWKGKIVIE